MVCNEKNVATKVLAMDPFFKRLVNETAAGSSKIDVPSKHCGYRFLNGKICFVSLFHWKTDYRPIDHGLIGYRLMETQEAARFTDCKIRCHLLMQQLSLSRLQ